MRTTRIRIKKWFPERVSFREASVWYHMSFAWATPAQPHLDGLFHSAAKKCPNSTNSPVFRAVLQLFNNRLNNSQGHRHNVLAFAPHDFKARFSRHFDDLAWEAKRAPHKVSGQKCDLGYILADKTPISPFKLAGRGRVGY